MRDCGAKRQQERWIEYPAQTEQKQCKEGHKWAKRQQRNWEVWNMVNSSWKGKCSSKEWWRQKAEKLRKMEKREGKRFHREGINAPKAERGRIGGALWNIFKVLWLLLKSPVCTQPFLLFLTNFSLFPQFLLNNTVIFLLFVQRILRRLSCFWLPSYIRRQTVTFGFLLFLLSIKSFSDSLLNHCSIKHWCYH